MAISTTYLLLQKAVADELGNRTDLLAPLSDSGLTLSPIKNAIQSAISKWEREPFYFNEVYDTDFFSTVSGQEIYGVGDAAEIGTSANIERLRLRLSTTSRYVLAPRRWTYLEDIAAATTTGKPTDYAYFAQQIRLFPIPDATYIITMTGTRRFTALSADGDINVWTQDGYDLIRSEAKLILADEVLHDTELAASMERAIYGNPQNERLGYLSVIQAETARRRGLGLVRAAPNLSGIAPATKNRQV